MKDLSSDVTKELHQRLQANKAAMEKVSQFFGLRPFLASGITDLKDLFPDTTVSVLKKCFEALRMYDLAEILEKARPRSLRPALSPEQIEKLWRAGDRPTKYHSNVAVLVVDHTVEEDIVEINSEEIETFFKDLNSRNEVTTISLASSQESRKILRERKYRRYSHLGDYHLLETSRKTHLERVLQRKARLEKELVEVKQMKKGRKQRRSVLELNLKMIRQDELRRRGELENTVKEREQRKRDIEKLKELEKGSTKPISTAMDEWIDNKG